MVQQNKSHILILTHGGWGKNLVDSLGMIVGEIKDVYDIALMPADTFSEFYQKVKDRVATMPAGSLVLTDFMGGTTSNVAARLSLDYDIAVISGLSASLLIEAIDRQSQGTLTQFIDPLLEVGQSSCKNVVAEIQKMNQEDK